MTITNSTFSSNSAGDGGGGAIMNKGTLTITNSTISGNSAGGIGSGGGIRNNGTATVKNTIVANNIAGFLGPDCNGIFNSDGNNLIEDSSFCTGFTNGQNGDITGVDPVLDALADNGGPTLTHALLEGSPAVDAVPVADCTEIEGGALTNDQRGIDRPQGDACDIGAFEVVSPKAPAIPQRDPYADLTASGIAKGGATAPDPTSVTSINCFKQDSEETAKLLAEAAETDPDAVSEVIARGAGKGPSAVAALIAKGAETNLEVMAEVLAKAAEMEREAIANVFTEVSEKDLDGLVGVVAQAAILKPLVLAEVIATGAENNREAIVRLLTRASQANPQAIAALPDIATIRDGSPISSKATVIVTGLAPLGDGKAYEGWFVSDDGERKQSAGIVELDELGNGVATYVNENGENVLGSFNTFVITVEPVPDDDPGPSGEVALVHTVPVGGITHTYGTCCSPGYPTQLISADSFSSYRRASRWG